MASIKNTTEVEVNLSFNGNRFTILPGETAEVADDVALDVQRDHPELAVTVEAPQAPTKAVKKGKK